MTLTHQQLGAFIDLVYPKVFLNNDIPSSVIKGQAMHESSGDTTAYASDRNGGSYGLMQVDKDVLTAIGFDPSSDLMDPTTNLIVGMTYMKLIFRGEMGNPQILNLTDYTLKVAMALVCYNCGVGNFVELYNNHLANKTSEDWTTALKDSNFVMNWSSCLAYPCYVFIAAFDYYNLPIDSIQPSSVFNYPGRSFKYGLPFLTLS